MIASLQYITPNTEDQHLVYIRQALSAGCKWIQLRDKTRQPESLLPIAKEARLLCNVYQARLIINDHVELARTVEADGVHLGLNDMPVNDARAYLGAACIIGGTVNTMADIRKCAAEKVDYMGLGPYRFTTTKKKLSPVCGLKGFQKILAQMREENIRIPIIAVGGIKTDDLADLIPTGIQGIAVSGLLSQAGDKTAIVQSIISHFQCKH